MIWWDANGKPLREAIDARPVFRLWWDKFAQHKWAEIGFQYELSARLEKVTEGKHPHPFSVRKTHVPVYPFGKPFCDLTQHEYGALSEACMCLLEHPKRGHEAAEMATFACGDLQHAPVGRGKWTGLLTGVKIGEVELEPFAVNLNRSNRVIIAELRRRPAAGLVGIGLPPRTDSHVKTVVEGLREKHRIPSPRPERGWNESRNCKPWTLVEAVGNYQKHFNPALKNMSWEDARKENVENEKGSIPDKLRKRVEDAEEAYSRFVSLFEENYGPVGWETPWEAALRHPPLVPPTQSRSSFR